MILFLEIMCRNQCALEWCSLMSVCASVVCASKLRANHKKDTRTSFEYWTSRKTQKKNAAIRNGHVGTPRGRIRRRSHSLVSAVVAWAAAGCSRSAAPRFVASPRPLAPPGAPAPPPCSARPTRPRSTRCPCSCRRTSTTTPGTTVRPPRPSKHSG